MPRWSIAVVCIALGGGAFAAGCRKPQAPADDQSKRVATASDTPYTAELWTVTETPWPAIVRTQGNLVADEVAVIGAKVAGRVEKTEVDLGQFVEADQPLVTLDRTEFEMLASQAESTLLQARSAVGLRPGDPMEKLNPENAPPVREARAVWDEAKARRERWNQLREENAAAKEEYEQIASVEKVAEARYASALNGVYEKIATIKVRMAEFDLAQDRLNETRVIAPFRGMIQERHVAAGAYVQVGQSLMTLIRINPLRFQGMVPERVAQSLKVGQELLLKIESVDIPRRAQVTRISPTLEPRSRSLLFEAVIDNPDNALRAGLFAEAEVTLDESAVAISVPIGALVEFAGAEKVWTVIEGKAKEQTVQTGRRSKDRVEILRGLRSGDIILIDGKEGRSGTVNSSQPAASLAGPQTSESPKGAAATTVEGNAATPTPAEGNAVSGAGP